MSEVIGAFVWCEGTEDLGDCVPECVPGSRCGLAQQRLELGESQLDGIEIGRIGRQVEKGGASGLDRGADALDLVGGQIIEGVLSSDHIHIFVSVPPHVAISDLMRRAKGRSSYKIQIEFPEIRKRYWGRRFWARGYF